MTTASIDAEKLKACIHCGMCLPVCPTYRVTGSEAESPRGRLYLMKKMLDGQLETPQQLATHLDLCLGCQACQTACPSGVQYGELLFNSREVLAAHQPPSKRAFKRFIFHAILPNRALLKLGGFLLSLYQRIGLQRLVQASQILTLFPRLAQREALLPKVPKHQSLKTGMAFGNPDGERVVLFIGCVMDVFYNPVHWATLQVLVANNYYVYIPEQTCCGALAHHAGETDIARKLAQTNIRYILKTNPDWIVLNSAGCGASLKEYGHLLSQDPAYGPKAAQFSTKIVDIVELLAKKPLAPMTHPVHRTVTYHAACHLHHAQGVKAQPEQVLSQIPGLQLVPLQDADSCCGSAGIYNLEHPELSEEILALKTRRLQETQADAVVTGNPGCLLQINHGIQQAGLPMDVLHPIQLLAAAYGHPMP